MAYLRRLSYSSRFIALLFLQTNIYLIEKTDLNFKKHFKNFTYFAYFLITLFLNVELTLKEFTNDPFVQKFTIACFSGIMGLSLHFIGYWTIRQIDEYDKTQLRNERKINRKNYAMF